MVSENEGGNPVVIEGCVIGWYQLSSMPLHTPGVSRRDGHLWIERRRRERCYCPRGQYFCRIEPDAAHGSALTAGMNPRPAGCVASRTTTIWMRRVRQNNPTGKSLLIFRNGVKPQNKKYFAFPEGQNRAYLLPSRPDQRGVS
jgi:hypothetical protein